MRSESEIRKKLRDAKQKYLTREYEDKLSKCPDNCIHNYRHTTTDPDTGEEVEIGLCMYGVDNPEEWEGVICDDKETAQRCPYFECKHNEEGIREQFEEDLQDDVIVAHEYKDIAALQWVLEDKVYAWDLTWFQRFQLWFLYKVYQVNWFLAKSGVTV